MPVASTRARAGVPGTVFDGPMGSGMGEIVVLRHGQTEWSRSGQHTERDRPAAAARGRGAGAGTCGRRWPAAGSSRCWVSPRQRARRTAELAGLTPTADRGGPGRGRLRRLRGPDDGGDQRRAGRDRGRSGRDGTVPGDTPGRDAGRGGRAGGPGARPGRGSGCADGDVALVAHGHVLRVLTARWLGLAAGGRRAVRAARRQLRRPRARARPARCSPAGGCTDLPAADRLPPALRLLGRRLAAGPGRPNSQP